MKQHFRTALLAAAITAPTAAGGAWLAGHPAATTAQANPGFVNITDFGCVADGAAGTPTDNTANLQAALDSGTNEVLVPPGVFMCRGKLHVRRGLTLRGVSGSQWYCPSEIRWGLGTDAGICLDSYGDNADQGQRADWCCVEKLALRQFYGPSVSYKADGITAHCPFSIRDCWVDGFTGDGIHVEGYVDGAPAGNPNLWQVRDTMSSNNQGSGLYVKGTDSNAGTCIALSAIGNKQWGVDDNSFLGNLYLGNHYRDNLAGPDRYQGGVNYSTVVGCYTEGGSKASSYNPFTYVLGGQRGAGTAGGQRLLPGDSTLRLQSNKPAEHLLRLTGSSPGSGYCLSAEDGNENTRAYITKDGVIGTREGGTSHFASWGLRDQTLWSFGVQDGPYSGSVGRVVARAAGGNYGQGQWVLQTLDATANQSDTLTLQNARVTVGSGGLALPAFTAAQRNALAAPAAGTALVIWNRDKGKVEGNDGSGWR
jgi:hypothetical protein